MAYAQIYECTSCTRETWQPNRRIIDDIEGDHYEEITCPVCGSGMIAKTRIIDGKKCFEMHALTHEEIMQEL